MKRLLSILCVLACLQILPSCIADRAARIETETGTETDTLTAVKTKQQMPSHRQAATIRNTVADFLCELNDNKMPKTGSELTCCEFGSATEVLSFICSNLLLHPTVLDFPYNKNKACYDYHSESLQLQFKEPGSGAGTIAQIDIWFLETYRDIKADSHYTVIFKKR